MVLSGMLRFRTSRSVIEGHLLSCLRLWSLILYVVCTYYVRSMCMYVVICKIDHCIHIHWCIPMGLGHDDPWVESHIRSQHMWGQRSSRGQWPLVQVLAKTVTVSTYFDVFSGETRGLRTTLCEKGNTCSKK